MDVITEDSIKNLFDKGDYITIRSNINNFTNLDNFIYYKIKLERMEANYDEALELAHETIKQDIPPFLKADILIEICQCNWYLGKFNKNHEILEEINNIIEENPNYTKSEELRAHYYNLKALSSFKKIQNREVIDLFYKSAELKLKLGMKAELALSYNNIGFYHFNDEKLEKAIGYFTKSFEINKELQNIDLISLNLLNIIQATVVMNDLTNSKKYLDMLEHYFTMNQNNKRTKMHFMYSKALILSKSTNLRQKIEAEDIFLEIINSKIVHSSFYEKSIFNVCLLYIYQLKMSFSDEIFKELNKLIIQLEKFGEKTSNYSITLKAKFLKVKVLILDNKISNAKYILMDLIEESKDHHEKNTERIILIELENLLNHEKLVGMVANASVEENVKNNPELTSFIDSLIHGKSIIRQEEKHEKPVALFILNNKGQAVYTKSFTNEMAILNEKIGNFIQAINLFGNETFGELNSYVNKIKHNQYIITVKQANQNLYGYIYQGDTNTSLVKLNNFIDNSKNEVNLMNSGTSSNIEPKLDEISTNIFEYNQV
ncbi:MAG: hypothetical protein OEY49_09030 [Candidatus Heimdallarchaeota archaeon]|nr:hypothetical protein [Candidatus Heimdallarchaeota archaeon]